MSKDKKDHFPDTLRQSDKQEDNLTTKDSLELERFEEIKNLIKESLQVKSQNFDTQLHFKVQNLKNSLDRNDANVLANARECVLDLLEFIQENHPNHNVRNVV